jgi:hypothetical protein
MRKAQTNWMKKREENRDNYCKDGHEEWVKRNIKARLNPIRKRTKIDVKGEYK